MQINNNDLISRLKKVEGQIRGITNMVQSNRPCEDILIQILGVEGAINKIGKSILKRHLNHCVKASIERGEVDLLAAFNTVLDKFID